MRRPTPQKSAIGATRNHTSSFLQLREQAKKREYGRPSESEYDHAQGWEAARHRLPPRWVEVVEGCNQSITDIRSKRTWRSVLFPHVHGVRVRQAVSGAVWEGCGRGEG
jgi:hypothetical protein